jgi:hypothetical protein
VSSREPVPAPHPPPAGCRPHSPSASASPLLSRPPPAFSIPPEVAAALSHWYPPLPATLLSAAEAPAQSHAMFASRRRSTAPSSPLAGGMIRTSSQYRDATAWTTKHELPSSPAVAVQQTACPRTAENVLADVYYRILACHYFDQKSG